MENNNLFTEVLLIPGTKVTHKEYGAGVIVKALPDKIYVSFDGQRRIFTCPECFIKGYLCINEMNTDFATSEDTYRHPTSIANTSVSSVFSKVLDKYFEQFPARWESEKYIWTAVQTFQDRWDPDASNFSQMLSDATIDADYLMNASLYYPRDMIVGLAQVEPAYVKSMFKSLFDEDIDIAIRAEKFSADAELIRTKYKGKFYSRNYQTMNAVSTYLWLMYPDKYYFYKYAVAQKVALETGLSYKPGKIAEVRKMIHQFSLMDEISAILRQDDRSRQFLNPRLDKTTYFDNQLHCMAMDFAFFIRPCYANRKE